MELDKEEFQLPFFIENGFVRKRCANCNSYFWSQNTDVENCGDAPCQPYTFLGHPPTKRSFTLDEMRESFLTFFERHGHTKIKPYPVIARWRDDLLVTIASIANFQPFVTEGIIPPPANPLVISQPCLRFNDIDNVGLTAGRHFTIFEMGGAHAFNYPDNPVYWKDETIRLHHEFVTDILGVNSELVTYKEGLWSGGGNAGPDVEGCIKGLEVSTLVFMQYKVVGEQLIDMPIKIVDTGYGIERFAWLSQGSPSGFHAIYGTILDTVMDFVGLGEVDARILVESTRYSALMNVETAFDKMALRRKVAAELGMNYVELDQLMTSIEGVYALVDHTKALVFMLADGVVPSNVRVGYLARLLLRRAFRLLRQLEMPEKLSEIIRMQVRYWSQTFPNIEVVKKEIFDAVSIEERKYRDTLKRGVELSKKIATELKSQGEAEIPVETLVELYDSHGISPEIVQDAVKAEGMRVMAPENFYTMIAQRQASSEVVLEERRIFNTLDQIVTNLPPTSTLYYTEPYLAEFKARVLLIADDRYVVLDGTAFYPESGGQDSDHGFLEGGGKQVTVLNALKIGNVIVHETEGNVPFLKGDEVVGRIDWTRRVSLMRHHTSTHLVLGAARAVVGQHVWQAGAKKEVTVSRLDVSHWSRMTPEQIRKIEENANAIVMANLPVEISWMSRGEAERRYGYRLYQGGVVPGDQIRVVKIGDWDVEACGGTHVRSTGEIGFIKILHTDRIQDGVDRIVFASGSQAVRYVQRLEDDLKKVADTLDVPLDEVTKAVQGTHVELKKITNEVEQLKKGRLESELREMLTHAKTIDNLRLMTHVTSDVDSDSMIKVSANLIKEEPHAIIIMFGVDDTARVTVIAGERAVNRGVNSGRIASKIAEILGGGGSGQPNFGQGGGSEVAKVDVALKMIEAIVVDQLRGGRVDT